MPVCSTLVDVRRRSWTTHLRRRCVTPFDLWVENPAATRSALRPETQTVRGMVEEEVSEELFDAGLASIPPVPVA